MNTIKINPQEVYVWLAFTDGWHKYAGHIITIQGIDFSVVAIPNFESNEVELVFSVLESGSKFQTVPMNILEVLNCDTKEKMLTHCVESALFVMTTIDKIGKNCILNRIRKDKIEKENIFGKIPAIEKMEMR